MLGVGLIFLTVGLADLAAGGVTGVPASRGRSVAGLILALLVALGGALGFGFSAAQSLSLLLLAAVGLTGWLFLRSTRPGVALSVLVASLLLAVLLSPLWSVAASPPLTLLLGWLASVPFSAFQQLGGERIFLALGILLFLLSSANGIVRALLQVAGSRFQASESQLQGGRLIGILERFLIFGLAVAGEPTAAALVVSAKSILRFPELNRTSQSGVDHVTEYFLLGSLASWMAALAPALLLLAK